MTTSELARPQPSEVLRHIKAAAPHLRMDTLNRALDVVQAIITGQSVNLGVLCGHLPGTSSVDAGKHRAEGALRDEQLTGELFLSLLLLLRPPGKLILSLDRTFLARTAPLRTLGRTWKHGDTPLNLLVLGVVLHGYTLPLVWTAFPHDGSSTDARLDLVQRLLKALPASRWKGLVADREFIGSAWFTFLRRQRIKRAIRIRKNAVVDGLRIDKWFNNLQVGEVRELFESRGDASRDPLGGLRSTASGCAWW